VWSLLGRPFEIRSGDFDQTESTAIPLRNLANGIAVCDTGTALPLMRERSNPTTPSILEAKSRSETGFGSPSRHLRQFALRA